MGEVIFLPRPGVKQDSPFEWHTIVGDYMEPTVRSGDLVMVNRRDRGFNGLFWVLNQGVGHAVRLSSIGDPSSVKMTYDNPAYSPMIVPAKSLTILGRVAWKFTRAF